MADIDRLLTWAAENTGSGTAEAAHSETRRMLTVVRSMVEDYKTCSRRIVEHPDSDVRACARRVEAALADCEDSLYEVLRDIERQS